jgi:hypothetical protein
MGMKVIIHPQKMEMRSGVVLPLSLVILQNVVKNVMPNRQLIITNTKMPITHLKE